jgi:hypothetical protein
LDSAKHEENKRKQSKNRKQMVVAERKQMVLFVLWLTVTRTPREGLSGKTRIAGFF